MKKSFFVLSVLFILSLSVIHAFAADVFSVDPDAQLDEVTEPEETEYPDGTIIYDAQGNQIYPPLVPIELDEFGNILNPDCELANPLADNEYYKALVGEITEDDHVVGPDDAVMTFIEYADFQCPGCASTYSELKKYQEEHSDTVRIVYRHYPLAQHELALPAAYIAEAAAKQGHFFEAADILFQNTDTWSSMTEDAFTNWFVGELKSGAETVNTDTLLLDYSDEEMRNKVLADLQTAVDSGLIAATPTLLLNYSPYSNGFSESAADKWLDIFSYREMLYAECPEFSIDVSGNYKAEVETSKGNFEIELYPQNAPLAVSNFIYLAQNGWYDNMPVSAVVEGYAVQFGDPSATGYLNAGYDYAKEANASEFETGTGYVTMYEGENGKNSSIILMWLDLYSYYLDIFAEAEDTAGDENAEYSASLAIHDITKHTVIGKITGETYPVAAELTATDIIKSIRINEE